ncbi:MAG: GNAT family N-acetyltransferase [Gemmatimonadetes bacterium]|nr:GNAT family N-acetyltransferase [Gemmatimonadota bacterium]
MTIELTISAVNRELIDLSEESRLMQRSWVPPCLDYSARLLQWYARSSNSLPAFVVRARLAGDLVGFGMALPRRFRTNSWEGDGYIKSFMTVDPAARGRGIGVSLRVALLREVRKLGMPVLRFGEGMTEVRERLRADYASADYVTVDLGTCPSASFVASESSESVQRERAVVLGDKEFLKARESFAPSELLSVWQTPESLNHYAQDFRPRAKLGIATGPSGWRALASVVLADFATKHGGQSRVALVEDAVLSAEATPEDLRELSLAIGASMLTGARGQVTLSNTAGVPPLLLSSAGFRKIPSRYSALLAVPDARHPLASGTHGTTAAVT